MGCGAANRAVVHSQGCVLGRVCQCGCAVVLEEACAPTHMTCGCIHPRHVGHTLWLEVSSKLSLGHLTVHVFHGEGASHSMPLC